jgi:hypothetical protein
MENHLESNIQVSTFDTIPDSGVDSDLNEELLQSSTISESIGDNMNALQMQIGQPFPTSLLVRFESSTTAILSH